MTMALLVLCAGYILVMLFLRWLEVLDDDMPMPDPLPCANCGATGAYSRIIQDREKAWVAYCCDRCPVQAPPIPTHTKQTKYGQRIDRKDLALALKIWNEIMKAGPQSTRQDVGGA